MPRIHHYISKDVGKEYNKIKDFLVMLDISGMYVYIMRTFKFPYGKSRYASKLVLDNINLLLNQGVV